MATAGSGIEISGLRVTRGGTPILHGIDLDVPAGGVFGLIGPSGSGKTTLIRAIVGLQRITGGSVTVGGLPAGHPELRARIGYMPQAPAVYADLTARENLRFLAAAYRVPPRRAEEILELVDLGSVIDRPVATYSGGQRQRVSLAAALLPDPDLLLLDEPTVGLDPRLRVRLWALFRERAAAGTTVVVSTHVMDEAAKVDRLAFLSEGRVAVTGAPAELIARAGAADLEAAVLTLDPAGEATS